jgi:hypothetical protein
MHSYGGGDDLEDDFIPDNLVAFDDDDDGDEHFENLEDVLCLGEDAEYSDWQGIAPSEPNGSASAVEKKRKRREKEKQKKAKVCFIRYRHNILSLPPPLPRRKGNSSRTLMASQLLPSRLSCWQTICLQCRQKFIRHCLPLN